MEERNSESDYDDDDYLPSNSSVNKSDTGITYEQKKKAVEYFHLTDGRKRKLSSVTNRFTYVKTYEQLNRWQKHRTLGYINGRNQTTLFLEKLLKFYQESSYPIYRILIKE